MPSEQAFTTKRLKTISPIDIKRYYDVPLFSAEDQKYYFVLDVDEESIVGELRTYSSKFYFTTRLF